MASTACDGGQDELLVFAASSLTNAMERIGDEFQESEGIKVSFNFGSSGSLAQQIVRNAPADVYVAAGAQPMQLLEDRGLLVSGTRSDLLTNELVVAVDAADGPEIASVQDLVDGDYRIAMAHPDLAPAGEYAREALETLGLWSDLESRLIFGSNVRTTLAYLETGNVDAAILYRTDTAISADVRVAAIVPEDSYTPVVYPAAVVLGSQRQAAARRFLDFLTGDRATAIFSNFDFTQLGSR